MKKYLMFYILTTILSVLIVSCSERYENSDKVNVGIYVNAGTNAKVENPSTKVIVDGSNQNKLTELNLCVEAIDSDNLNWYNDHGYDRIKVTGSSYGQNWRLTLRDQLEGSEFLGLFKSKGNVNIYGFSPMNNSFNPSDSFEIPFEVGNTNSTNIDYMRIAPKLGLNPNTISSGSTIPFDIEHVMTCMHFRIFKYYVGKLVLKNITLEIVDAGDNPLDVFGMRGTYNIKTGDVTLDNTSYINSLKIDYNIDLASGAATPASNNYYSFYMLFPEIDFSSHPNASKLKVRFEIEHYMQGDDQKDELVGVGSTLEMDLSAIKDTNNIPITSFDKDNMYLFPITIYNFIKYHMGVPTKEPWSTLLDENGNEIENEIKV